MILPDRNNPYHLLYVERASFGLKYDQGRVKEHLRLQYSIKTSRHTELLVGEQPKTHIGSSKCSLDYKSVKEVQNSINNFSSKFRGFLNIGMLF